MKTLELKNSIQRNSYGDIYRNKETFSRELVKKMICDAQKEIEEYQEVLERLRREYEIYRANAEKTIIVLSQK